MTTDPERIEALEAKCALLSASLNRADDELNREKAKTEYEAERAGNIENDLDDARAKAANMLAALLEAIPCLRASDYASDRKVADQCQAAVDKATGGDS
jgi:hypothetical protein